VRTKDKAEEISDNSVSRSATQIGFFGVFSKYGFTNC